MLKFLLSALGFAKVHWKLLAAIGLALAVVGAVAYIYSSGKKAGVAQTEIKQEKAHSESVATARKDERTAQDAADAIGSKTADTNTRQRADTETILKGIRNDLPKPDPARSDPVVPDSVRAASNELVNRANRAAEAAERTGGTAPERAPVTD